MDNQKTNIEEENLEISDFLKSSKLKRECVKVNKVYDWIIKKTEQTQSVPVPSEFLPAVNDAIAANHILYISGSMPVENVTANVIYIKYGIPYTIDGKTILISCVQILKTATATITIYDQTARVELARFDTTQQFLEKAALCVPVGLDENNIFIKTIKTNLVVLNNRAPINGALNVQFDFCQDIQVEAEVKLELIGTLCHSRVDNIQCPDPASIDCEDKPFPTQCPLIFPK